MQFERFEGRLGRAAFLTAVVLATVAGCGGGSDLPELVAVSGRVTLTGQPIPEAKVTFEPQKGAMSIGSTDADGRFELYYPGNHKGAVVGQHKVKISKMEGEAGDETIPRQYNENSKLTQEVTKAGPNDFTFDLKK